LLSIGSAFRGVSARAGALVAALPLLLGGALPAEAATAGHVFSPAMSDHVRYQFLGAAIEADGQVKFSCQIRNRNPLFPAPFCYGPDQIRAAYEVQPLLDAGIDGSGRTIVIVDAFQSPTIRGDLAAFDARWGYPAPPSFSIVAPDGLATFDITNDAHVMWSMEISLDVEWAHVMAPGAAIALVLSKSDDDEDMLNAAQYAVDHNLGDVISMSFGEAETCAGPLAAREHDIFEAADAKGITLFAAAGDFGSAQHACGALSYVSSASSPATDPLVTGVGGTQLMADAFSGAYQSETAWNNPRPEPELGATGGGFSSLYRRPGYQAPFQDDKKRRGVPDVAFAADMRGGLISTWSVLCGIAFNCAPTGGVGYFGFGGTSAGSPQWAAFAVLADQVAGHRIGSINKELYHIGKSADYADAFHDVSSGNNAFGGIDGFSAGPVWDAATGLGTPRVAGLVPMLAKTAPANNR
jgi:subtilase family serine protease